MTRLGRRFVVPLSSKMAAISESNSCTRSRSAEPRRMPTDPHFGCDSDKRRNSTPSVWRHLMTWLSCRPCLAYFLVVTLGLTLATQMNAQTVEESQVKAAYLYNLAKFVEWPAAVFPHPDDPVVICVVGDEHTGDVLGNSIHGKKANGRPIQMRPARSREEFKSCHILFVGFSEKDRIADVLHPLRGSSVLTVGQSPDFLPLGGMINLAHRDSTIELEIDPEVPNLVGLKVSSRLLFVARIVKVKKLIESAP